MCRVGYTARIMLTQLHLIANAVLYFGLAAWCTIAPAKTSDAIGYRFQHASARSEYIVIYGGLELGLGIFYLLAALDDSLLRAGILFSVCLYGCLAVYRIGTIVTIRKLGSFPYAMLAIEAGMAIWAVAAWLSLRG